MSFFSHVGGGEVERICDLCGIRRAMRRLRSVGKYYVCEKHPGYVTREALDRTPYISVGAPEGVTDAKGFEPRDTFEAGEAEIFSFLTNDYTIAFDAYSLVHASLPVRTTSTVGTALSAGATAIYLYDLINEAMRPLRWIEAARTRLKGCADWLMANMAAGPEIAGTTDDQWQWGGYLQSGSYFPGTDTSAAGIALLRAYQTFGKSRYLDGARACAWFLRTAQCGDLLVSGRSTADVAGNSPKHWGMWATAISSAGAFTHTFTAGDLQGMEFLHLFQSIAGDEVIGSSTVTATFASSRSAKVSTAIQEVKAFWTTPQWSIDDGAFIQGLSTETPRDNFSSFPGGRGSWRFRDASPTSSTVGTTVTGPSFAIGISAFYAVDGATSFVTGLFDWLVSFESSSVYELPSTTSGRVVSGYDERTIWDGQRGTYDSTLAVALVLTVRAGSPLAYVKRNGSPVYELYCTGLLASLYSSRQLAAFKSFKEALSIPRPRTVDGDGTLYLGILGRCGLSFQPWTSVASFPSRPTNRAASAALAARLGAVYRKEPKAFMGRGL